MYKKFLNAILFGALILGSAGTITSCKDYDDEIDEINQKLNTLSSKDELAAQVSSLTSTISAAQSAAAQASTEAANALAAAKEAAAQAEQAATGAGQATGQAAEAITNAKAAATTADAAAKTATDAAAKAKAAAEDAAKAVAAGADATKAIAEAKAASEAAAKAAEEAKAGVEAAKKAAADAAAGAATAAQKAVADAQKAIAEAAQKAAEAAAKEAAAAAVKTELGDLTKRVEALEKGGSDVDLEQLNKDVKAASEKVDAIVGKIAGAVTSVSLIDSYTAADVLVNWYAKRQDAVFSANFPQGPFANFYWEARVLREATQYLDVDPTNDLELNFSTSIEKASYTFGQGWDKFDTEHAVKDPDMFPQQGAKLAGAFDFKKGTQRHSVDYFVVRVSPTNAVLKPEQIQLVNSQGVNLDEIVKITNVYKYDGLLSRPAYTSTRGEQETGLWIVEATLKEYDAETFNALTQFAQDIPFDPFNQEMLKATSRAQHNQDEYAPSGEGDPILINKILYAVQVNNTQEDAADRFVTSSYDLTLGWEEFHPANRLHFSVNGTPVENINNRSTNTSLSFLEEETYNFDYAEKAWLGDSVDIKANINYGKIEKTADLINADSVAKFEEGYNMVGGRYVGYPGTNFPDDRSDKQMIPAVNGQTITVTLAPNQGWAQAVSSNDDGSEADPYTTYVTAVPTASSVRAMYVVLDQPNSVESKPSEWAAWTSYSYTGLNEVVEGTSVNITIDCGEHTGDIIGFRVYAVNYDGTLVDPDGRAFYVQLGDGKGTGAVDTKIVPQNDVDIKVADTLLFSGAEEFVIDVKGATSYTWTADVINYLADTSLDPEDAEPMLSFYPALFNKGTKAADMFDKIVWSAADGDKTYTRGVHTGYSGSMPADYSKIGLLATVPAIPDWLAYIDGKTYSGTLTLYNEDSHTGTKRAIKTIKITFTKELPTGAPAGYSRKTKQFEEGQDLYKAYLVPDTWKVTEGEKEGEYVGATNGTMPILHVLNFGEDDAHVTANAERYQITFATTDTLLNDKGEPVKVGGKIQYTAPFTVAGNDTLQVPAPIIDNKTKHTTSVVYNYGKISTALYQKALEQSKENDDVYTDYVIEVDKFETEYHDIYDDTYSWKWITLAYHNDFVKRDPNKAYKTLADAKAFAKEYPIKPEVVYGAGSGDPGDAEPYSVDLKYFYGVSTRDGKYNAPLSQPYAGADKSLIVTDAILISNDNGKEEYFEIEIDGTTLNFSPLQDENGINAATNPTADVPSTLVIKLVDMYTHQHHTAKVAMTVKKR